MSNDTQHQKPEFEKQSFHCPFCNVYAQQCWWHLRINSDGSFSCTALYPDSRNYFKRIVSYSECVSCGDRAYWLPDEKRMVYPKILSSPRARPDMPDSVKELYEEARNISSESPRAAAALLRCALERLTEGLGEKEGSLNERIGNLQKRGLPSKVQEALDIVRINANEGGSHPGEIDLSGDDGAEVVDKLFWLVNFIIEKVITEPREIQAQFNRLPENKKKGIKDRDANNR